MDKLKGLLIIACWFSSLFFLLTTPREIINVYSVNNAQAVNIRIDDIYLSEETCTKHNNSKCDYIEISATYLESGQPVENIIQIEPGVLPFGIILLQKQIWSTQRAALETYQADSVQSAFLSNRGIYYLKKGSYFPFAYLFVFSILWLGVNALLIAKRS